MKLTRFFFFAALFAATFEKVRWNVAGNVTLADVLSLAFIGTFGLRLVIRRDRHVARAVAVACFFLALFLVTYLAGYFNLESGQAIDQYWKGMIKWVIHFLFVISALVYFSRSSERFYLKALGWFTAGLVVNAAYGVVQLLTARSGVNLDNVLIKPITGGSSSINVYGIFEQTQAIFRPNALTGDPNHLGIMLIMPIVILTPLYLSLERGHRLKVEARSRPRLSPPRRDRDPFPERPDRRRPRGARPRGAVLAEVRLAPGRRPDPGGSAACSE